jgi:type I restriction enzyme R subunit
VPPTDVTEKNFEYIIEQTLLAGGPDADSGFLSVIAESLPDYGAYPPGKFHKRTFDEYDRTFCLLPKDLIAFLYATQPEEWAKFKKMHGEGAKDRIIQRLATEIDRRGTLDVLRKGIKSDGCKFVLAYFHPVSGLNETLQKKYAANIFSTVRQLHYSVKNDKSLDLALFLNGIPIFTAELKNHLTGQNVQHAIRQYQVDRDPKEPLLAFRRCLAHFAVDPDLVYVTTKLEGLKTRFLPFNQGYNGGAGNPPSWKSFATAYLWERVWSRDSILNLIQHFIQDVELEDEKGQKTGKRQIVFPRYHQLDAVRSLISDAKHKGAGQKYLIQHSAGSGKSNSIAWLAHQLSILHDDKDKRVFDSIIVVTDRKVLDRQLQRTVLQFEQVDGVVENIEKTSRQLKEALEDGKTIIVTTLQKFPVISKEISKLAGSRFAVIIDEAHSSQSGESTKSMKKVLLASSLEEAEELEALAEEEDIEDQIIDEMKARGRLKNVSFFAFTATPKPKTLELFGTKRPDGKFIAFSIYSMRQAIEEGFILDVLKNYTTYKTYWNLLKTIKDDPHYERMKASYLLKQFVDLSDHAIKKKVAIILDHFANQVMYRINNKAKAMIVTRSRMHAVHYKIIVDQIIKEKKYPFKALVAFSGTVKDHGKSYTESTMNGISDTQTAETFKQDQYRFLIVANKFQTGFDQPLLHTMYVDKKLGGVNAVQTLSRLNRVYPGKEDTMVLDFINEAELIQKAFEPYYDRTILTEGTDPNLLYDQETRLAEFHLFTKEDIDQFARLYFAPKTTQDKLHAALYPIVERYKAVSKEMQTDFRKTLDDYIRLYAFLSQVLPFTDADLEKLYVFGKFLIRKLPVTREKLPVEIQNQIDLDSYRVEKTMSGSIPLTRGKGEIEPMKPKGDYTVVPDDIEPLSQIIKELNDRFGTDFTEQDKVFIEQLEAKLAEDLALANSVKVNPPENARLTFDHVVEDKLQGMIDSNFKFYKQITDNPQFNQLFVDWLFERYVKRSGQQDPTAQ